MKLSSYIEILFWLSIKYFEEPSYECSKSFIWQDDISYAQTVYPVNIFLKLWFYNCLQWNYNRGMYQKHLLSNPLVSREEQLVNANISVGFSLS